MSVEMGKGSYCHSPVRYDGTFSASGDHAPTILCSPPSKILTRKLMGLLEKRKSYVNRVSRYADTHSASTPIESEIELHGCTV